MCNETQLNNRLLHIPVYGLQFKDFSECFGTERLTKSYTRLGSLYQLDSQLDPVQFLHFSAHNGAKVLFRKIFGT